jgi:hypothetical protein
MYRSRILGGVLVAASVVLLSTGASADSSVKTVNGHVEDQVVSDPCASPVGIFTAGRLTGGIQGDLEFTITSLPSTNAPGVLFFTAVSSIRTATGEIFCADSGSFTTTSGSDGEGVHLCHITGGAGEFEGASGYLQETFNFMGTVGQGDYRGKVVTSS